jgi:cysteine desulfurase / selenocysteine lyase
MTPEIRQQFPGLNKKIHGFPLIYFDSAATTHKPQSVIEAIEQFYTTGYGTVHRAVYEACRQATSRYNQVRQQAKGFLNARFPQEIIFTRGTTDGINCIATILGKKLIQKGDEILISTMEHHSNIVPWQMVCEERGALLKVIPLDSSGALDLETYKQLLSSRTKCVAVTHLSNALGVINPVKEMVRLAHEQGALVLVDGAQSAPHLPVDVQDLDADFFVFSGHKIYGPTGVGILYGKKELLEELPPYQGGGDMIEKVTFEKTTFQPPPLRFEAGTPMIAEVIGLGAALQFIQSLDRVEIAAWESQLTSYALQALKNIEGLEILGTFTSRGPIINFHIPGIHSLDVATFLDLKAVSLRSGHHCAQPLMRHFGLTSSLRISFGLYNTIQEIDIFIDSLQKIVQFLRK